MESGGDHSKETSTRRGSASTVSRAKPNRLTVVDSAQERAASKETAARERAASKEVAAVKESGQSGHRRGSAPTVVQRGNSHRSSAVPSSPSTGASPSPAASHKLSTVKSSTSTSSNRSSPRRCSAPLAGDESLAQSPSRASFLASAADGGLVPASVSRGRPPMALRRILFAEARSYLAEERTKVEEGTVSSAVPFRAIYAAIIRERRKSNVVNAIKAACTPVAEPIDVDAFKTIKLTVDTSEVEEQPMVPVETLKCHVEELTTLLSLFPDDEEGPCKELVANVADSIQKCVTLLARMRDSNMALFRNYKEVDGLLSVNSEVTCDLLLKLSVDMDRIRQLLNKMKNGSEAEKTEAQVALMKPIKHEKSYWDAPQHCLYALGLLGKMEGELPEVARGLGCDFKVPEKKPDKNEGDLDSDSGSSFGSITDDDVAEASECFAISPSRKSVLKAQTSPKLGQRAIPIHNASELNVAKATSLSSTSGVGSQPQKNYFAMDLVSLKSETGRDLQKEGSIDEVDQSVPDGENSSAVLRQRQELLSEISDLTGALPDPASCEGAGLPQVSRRLSANWMIAQGMMTKIPPGAEIYGAQSGSTDVRAVGGQAAYPQSARVQSAGGRIEVSVVHTGQQGDFLNREDSLKPGDIGSGAGVAHDIRPRSANDAHGNVPRHLDVNRVVSLWTTQRDGRDTSTITGPNQRDRRDTSSITGRADEEPCPGDNGVVVSGDSDLHGDGAGVSEGTTHYASLAPEHNENVAEEVEESAEERIDKMRRWARSLCLPQRGRELEDVRLVLPPLRTLKEYPLGMVDISPPACAANWEGRIRAPKVSQLGSIEPAWTQDTPVLDGPSELTEATSAANRAIMDEPLCLGVMPLEFRQKGPLLAAASGSSSAVRGSRPLLRSRTIVKPDGRPPVRGCDPMAGGLFSRDAQLDHVSLRKGLYDAQLIGGPRRTRRYLRAVAQ